MHAFSRDGGWRRTGASGTLRRFWTAFAAAACALAAALALSVAGAHGAPGASTRAARFLALAFALCAFPGGAAAATAFSLGGVPPRRALAAVIASGIAIGLLSLVMSSVVAPALAPGGARPLAPAADDRARQPAGLTLGELHAEVVASDREGTSAMTPGELRRANHLRWELQHRLALGALAPILACFGALANLWLRWPRRAETRAMLLWAVGVATLVVVYGSLEQSFDAAVTSTVLVATPAWRELLGPPLAVTVALAWPTWAVWRAGISALDADRTA